VYVFNIPVDKGVFPMKNIWIIILILLSLIIGFIIGSSYMKGNQLECITTLKNACDYSNKLTNITNSCTTVLKSYTGKEYTILDELPCDIITKR
jgi:hypothetical protein